MNIETGILVPMTEANQNFSKVVRLVDESGMAYSICKNHPFVDGNKRVSVTALLVSLRMNNIDEQIT